MKHNSLFPRVIMQIANIDHSVKFKALSVIISHFHLLRTFWNTCFSWCEVFYAAFQLRSTYLGILERNIPVLPGFNCRREMKEGKMLISHIRDLLCTYLFVWACGRKEPRPQQAEVGSVYFSI